MSKIERNAPVIATDGELGRVKHVVVDQDTREVAELVVEQNGHEWLIPMSAVASVDGGRVMLRASRSQLRRATVFDRDQFQDVDDEAAEDESQRRAVHGGAALLGADDDAVVVGETTPRAEARPGPRSESRHERPIRADDGETIQLREEELVARKERVQAGEVQIHKEIVSEEKTLDIPVTREEVFVERHAVEHRPSDRPIGDSETIEVPVYEEQVTVEKRAVVYEEVSVGKRQVQETERVSDTIRREVVDIETGGDLDVEDQDAPRGCAEPAPPRGS